MILQYNQLMYIDCTLNATRVYLRYRKSTIYNSQITQITTEKRAPTRGAPTCLSGIFSAPIGDLITTAHGRETPCAAEI